MILIALTLANGLILMVTVAAVLLCRRYSIRAEASRVQAEQAAASVSGRFGGTAAGAP